MQYTFNLPLLAQDIKKKVSPMGRAAYKHAGAHHSGLSLARMRQLVKLKKGNPGIGPFLKLCTWLQTDPGKYITKTETPAPRCKICGIPEPTKCTPQANCLNIPLHKENQARHGNK